MRSGDDIVILRAEKTHDDTVQLAGGHELHRFTEWDTNQYRKNSAEVVAVPSRLTDTFIVFQDKSGVTFYHDSFQMELKVGDTVIVDWTAICEENEIGPCLYAVPYKDVYAVERQGYMFDFSKLNFVGREKADVLTEAVLDFKRDGQKAGVRPFPSTSIIPLMSWVFLEEAYAPDVVEEDGIKVRKNAEGLVVQTPVEPLLFVAKVAYIGQNVHNAPPVLQVGDLAVVDLQWASTVRIHDKEYFAVRQQDIMAEIKWHE